eukprot:CAMPEP_0198354030 /NCGR_PEP_ID=MMETSP1450-20131203/113793_1 /TAXON_ID=753684 ORGANISM="Madagascaria erythrocladiodes, Strain CCMP3234" /NCGR_SAMPLE_ID=MMETSP1450 /ASSEMBLY_ACC=CAM_ASM_001115 /LENGTH=503 /DNA_ID=CAMNT_0044060251 /DNA_START=33 /DNA_END=1544 /DNA_ORIENTATION=+
MKCLAVLEERMHDLMVFYAQTEAEEPHCVVTQEFVNRDYMEEDIVEDPYCTRGFITAFRMLAPSRDAVCATTARTCHGALAELERQIGDSLYSGYVGYNGRQPGASKEMKLEKTESAMTDEKPQVGDARHTLVAYFQIHELAALCGIEKATADLGVRCFQYAASKTSLRNRNVESMATAALVCALERARFQYADAKERGEENLVAPIADMTLVCEMAGIPEKEIVRYLKVVNNALQQTDQQSSASVLALLKDFADDFDMVPKIHETAVYIAEKAVENNISSRRNPSSVAAASVYLAFKVARVEKTQTEICQRTSLTEVTLRKVFKELLRNARLVLPPYVADDFDLDVLAASAAETPSRTIQLKDEQQANNEEEAEEEVVVQEEDEPEEDFGDMFPAGVVVAPFAQSYIPPPPPPRLPATVVDSEGKAVNTSVAAKENPLIELFVQFARSGMFPNGTVPTDAAASTAGTPMPPLPPPLPDLQSTGVPNLQDPHTTIAMDIARET